MQLKSFTKEKFSTFVYTIRFDILNFLLSIANNESQLSSQDNAVIIICSSSGIGRATTLIHAQLNMKLIMTSRNEKKIIAVLLSLNIK